MALTVKMPAVPGALYMPEEVMVPPVAVHVTAVFEDGATVTVNWNCEFTCRGTLCGLTATLTGVGAALVVEILPPPQPSIASTNWREKIMRNVDNKLCRPRRRCTLLASCEYFIGAHFRGGLIHVHQNLSPTIGSAQIPIVPAMRR